MTDRPAATAPSPARRPAGRLHLSPRHRAQLEALLREHLPGVEVWAYGSRITGESHDGSDLDLVLRAPDLRKIQIGRLSDLWEALRESTIPFLVEARDWARLPEGFHGEIEREYVVLVEGTRGDERNSLDGSTAIAPSLWQYRCWGELATLEYGKALRNYRNAEGPYPVFGTNGRIGHHKVAMTNGPTVIVGRKGVYRGVHYSPGPCWIIDTAFHLKAKDDIDIRWAYYALLSCDINDINSGSAIPSTSREDFYALPVVEPPVSEQRAIARVLGALDDKIELNRRMNETLEAMARALFKSWFVDFDPVRAKMDGRDTGLPTDIADLFPGRLVDSEMGRIPEGWNVSPLEHHLDVTRGLSYKGCKLSENGLALHNLNSIHEGGGYKHEGLKYYKGAYRTHHTVHPGDVIVANTEQGHNRLLIGHAAIVPNRHCEGLFSHHLYYVQPRYPFTPEYICHLLNTRTVHAVVSAYATGTTVNMLPVDALRIPKVVVPEAQVTTMFETVARTIRERTEAIHEESEHHAQLRDTLLPRLVSGALRIKTRKDVVSS